MAIYELDLTTTPVDLSATLGVADGSAVQVALQVVGTESVYRMVSTTVPTVLTGAAFRYQPGETHRFAVHAGASDGDTYIMAGNGTARVVVDDAPGN